ncbi:cupin domain-containing protein [Muriicola sp.]|uniref:cupin domain-containing protein n=1 Tax=Muriicola sp. TaxID=2020856 RepID=UPI003C7453B6
MKRNQFMGAVAVVASFPFLSFTSIEKQTIRAEKGFKIPAGEGRLHGHIRLKGVNSNILDVKVSGSDTNGDLAIFEQTSLSPGKGTPLHVHHYQDEVFYVILGEYQFLVGAQRFTLTEGDHIFLPRAVPHAWTQVSERGKMNVLFQPAGKMEEFFLTMAALDHEPSLEEMNKVFEENEMAVVGPPLSID